MGSLSIHDDHKFDLITRNLIEFHDETELKSILQQRGELKLYWGVATTERPHIAYLPAIYKIIDFLNAGCSVTILLADLHAYLDNLKLPWDLLKHRSDFFQEIIQAMLKSFNISSDRVKFIRGTDYQLSKEYTFDTYRIGSIVTEERAREAVELVLKPAEHPVLNSLYYSCLQVLDEEYLKVDAVFGNWDQRKVYILDDKSLSSLGYKRRIHLIYPVCTYFQNQCLIFY